MRLISVVKLETKYASGADSDYMITVLHRLAYVDEQTLASGKYMERQQKC
jgi:hypothetical protein